MKLKELLTNTVNNLNANRCTFTRCEYHEVVREHEFVIRIEEHKPNIKPLLVMSKTYKINPLVDSELQLEQVREYFFRDIVTAAMYAQPLTELAKSYPINNEA